MNLIEYVTYRNHPLKELDMNLRFWRQFANQVRAYDGMEIHNFLNCRCALQWALEKLNGQAIRNLPEILELDRKVMEERGYIVKQVHHEIFKKVRREDKLSDAFWWWHLDEIVKAEQDEPLITAKVMRDIY